MKITKFYKFDSKMNYEEISELPNVENLEKDVIPSKDSFGRFIDYTSYTNVGDRSDMDLYHGFEKRETTVLD